MRNKIGRPVVAVLAGLLGTALVSCGGGGYQQPYPQQTVRGYPQQTGGVVQQQTVVVVPQTRHFAPPHGSYRKSCSHRRMQGTTLFARCRQWNGNIVIARLPNALSGGSDIVNCNGVLRRGSCAGFQSQPFAMNPPPRNTGPPLVLVRGTVGIVAWDSGNGEGGLTMVSASPPGSSTMPLISNGPGSTDYCGRVLDRTTDIGCCFNDFPASFTTRRLKGRCEDYVASKKFKVSIVF